MAVARTYETQTKSVTHVLIICGEIEKNVMILVQCGTKSSLQCDRTVCSLITTTNENGGWERRICLRILFLKLGWSYGTYGGEEKCVRVLMRSPEVERLLETQRNSLKIILKQLLKKIWGGVEWFFCRTMGTSGRVFW